MALVERKDLSSNHYPITQSLLTATALAKNESLDSVHHSSVQQMDHLLLLLEPEQRDL